MSDITTDEQIAATFFDNPSSQAVADAAVATQPATVEAAPVGMHDFGAARASADAVPIEVPAEIKALRDGESKMFDSRSAYASAIEQDAINDSQATDASPAIKLAFHGELCRMAADTGASPVEVREVVDIGKRIQADPPTPEIESEWVAEATKRVLDSNHGNAAEAQRDIDLARALVARDPRLAKILDSTRLGNHPRVIELCVQQARSEFARGRLTLKPKG